MPYASNADMPATVTSKIPSGDGQSMFRRVVNSQLESGKSESVAFASAWAALKRAGYSQNSEGLWVKKSLPSVSDVHVPTTDQRRRRRRRREGDEETVEKVSVGDRVSWNSSGGTARGIVRRIIRDGEVPGIDGDVKVTGSDEEPAAQIEIIDDDGEPTGTIVGHKVSTLRKAETYKPPESARNNARRVLRWKEEHGDEVKGMTRTGWARANQLASGENLSRETVGRMAAFERHRQNSKVADEYKGEPWKDAGHVAWLGWGGDSGISWAQSIVGKRTVTDDTFTTSDEAEARARDLGISGHHVHQRPDGQAVYMPGRTHAEYLDAVASLGGAAHNRTQVNPLDSEMTDGHQAPGADGILGALGQFLQSLAPALAKSHPPTESTEAREKRGPTVETYETEDGYRFTIESEITKADDEERLVWGWASVSTVKGRLVVDRQGDVIEPRELEKFATDYMMVSRVGKDMHDGEPTSVTVHSFPLTNEIAEAFGIKSEIEGWIICQKVLDDDVWAAIKSGERTAFSIGGRATVTYIDEEDAA